MDRITDEFLLNDAGQRIAIDDLPRAEGPTLVSGLDAVERAVTNAGFVFIASVGSVLFVKLLPETVAPLAALEAAYEVEDRAPECVVLAHPRPRWAPQRFELLAPTGAARRRMHAIARSASKRVALNVFARAGAGSVSTGVFPHGSGAGGLIAEIVV